jgi:hypothetical protein
MYTPAARRPDLARQRSRSGYQGRQVLLNNTAHNPIAFDSQALRVDIHATTNDIDARGHAQ